jgi:hypothetical protein
MKVCRLVPRLEVGVAVVMMALIASAACATGGGGGSRPAATASGQSAGACPSPGTDPAQVVDANRPAQDPQVLQAVGAGMCLTEVLDRLGPAHRYVPSGVFQFEWKATDGRTFQVGIPSLREKTVYARWSK